MHIMIYIACKTNDLSLVFVMDLSDSINDHSMDIGKQWIQQTMQYGQELLSRHELNFKSAAITFSSKVDIIWNLNDDPQTIHDKLDNLQRPHDILIEEGLTFTKDALNKVIEDILPLKVDNEQIVVVLLTDGLPSNDNQNPCRSAEISDKFHQAAVRTIVVGIEQGHIFDTAPFECLYYPYSTDTSFITVENYLSLLGYQMHPVIIDAAFPISCDS